jgi:hypothetical protein
MEENDLAPISCLDWEPSPIATMNNNTKLSHANVMALTVVEYPFLNVNHENIIGNNKMPAPNNKPTFLPFVFCKLPGSGFPQ